MCNGLINGICGENQVQIGWANLSALRHLLDKTDQLLPVIGAHDHDWEVLNFSSLNESKRFKQFVERACAAGHYNKGVGIFHQQRFADEKIMQPDAAIEGSVGNLLEWKLNIVADGATNGFYRAAVGSFYIAGSAISLHIASLTRNRL